MPFDYISTGGALHKHRVFHMDLEFVIRAINLMRVGIILPEIGRPTVTGCAKNFEFNAQETRQTFAPAWRKNFPIVPATKLHNHMHSANVMVLGTSMGGTRDGRQLHHIVRVDEQNDENME